MILGVLNQKGGVGKSSISANLAHTYASQGKSVLLVDADPQASSLTWSSAREIEPRFPVIGMAKPTLHKDLPAVARNYDITIIDGPGRNSDLTRAAVIASEFILIPCLPGAYDTWASEEVVKLYQEARTFNETLKAVFVLNGVIGKAAVTEGAAVALVKLGIPLLDTRLIRRVVYPESTAVGLAIAEKEPKNPAVKEIRKLAAEIQRAGDDYETMLETLAATIGEPTGG